MRREDLVGLMTLRI